MNKLFSGVDSEELWESINVLTDSVHDERVGEVIYSLCCKLQELENYVASLESRIGSLEDSVINGR